jgi:hypothetical protein
MRAIVFSIMAFVALAACQAEPPLEAVQVEATQEAVSVDESANAEALPPLCPLRWTCDEEAFYAAKSTCESKCSPGTCFYTPDCRGNCLCE